MNFYNLKITNFFAESEKTYKKNSQEESPDCSEIVNLMTYGLDLTETHGSF